MGQVGISGGKPQTLVLAVCPVNPEFEQMALDILNQEMVNAGTTIDATAFNEAVENMIKDYNTNIKENWFWMGILSNYLQISGYEQIVKAQTPESIAEFARKLYGAGNKIELVMAPEK